ncbi:Bug family tripartite tricarboxylate transporter substrate binding protein [Falsiroseomonas selenitidurans]|uniref:Tripartite tricarboxylate transporter substrate binding protein n=1 Tax=Falsiroseomonas selenitidurans TaxID=2716335 RepID=A0ABX1E807_9PROT|nr:tripartite tricarboxylate transporter substrate binding protein [Falsiroseomonas selenitidurans]NKC32908.1 tripartite tricarboxylate transporter substrate binding protein [Falsiroseomonas selenitidurans]
MRRRHLLASLPLLAAPTALRAQPAWPERPVRILVPFAPGGNTDALARLTADLLQAEIPGASFVVENRTGAGGLIAAEAMVRAPADGHTLMMVAVAVLAVAPVAMAQPPRFDPVADVTPIVNLGTNPFVLMAHSSVAATDLAGLIAWMRARNGAFPYASGGVGSFQHLSMALFLQRIGVQAEHVPYRGGAPALADLIAGNAPVMFANLSEAVPHAQNPAVRLFGVSGTTRAAALPEVPAIAEALPGFETITWNGLMGPKGLPPAIATRIHGIIAAALARPAVQARMAQIGADPLGEGPEPFAARLRADVARWGDVVRSAGIRVP